MDAVTAPADIAGIYGVVTSLRARRFRLYDEKLTQLDIATGFDADGIVYRREVRIGTGDIIDFVAGRIAIEVKVKGRKLEIYRQLERYAKREEIDAIVLASNVAMGLPHSIAGKPAYFVHLGKAWL